MTASRVSLGPISRSCPIARKLSSKPACTPNVERKLISCSVSYRLHRHCEFARPIRNPLDFARQLKYDLARITKTLLVRLPDGPPYALVTAPVGKRVNFSALARERGVKRLEIASPSEIQSVTGYPAYGVSPLGVAETKVYLDSTRLQFGTVLIGAGKPAKR
ncbi:MAG: YbaK/EbsC family protein [Bryobacteraceae bacterium]